MKLNTKQHVGIAEAIQDEMNRRIETLNNASAPLPFGGKNVVPIKDVHRIVARDFMFEVMKKITQ